MWKSPKDQEAPEPTRTPGKPPTYLRSLETEAAPPTSQFAGARAVRAACLEVPLPEPHQVRKQPVRLGHLPRQSSRPREPRAPPAPSALGVYRRRAMSTSFRSARFYPEQHRDRRSNVTGRCPGSGVVSHCPYRSELSNRKEQTGLPKWRYQYHTSTYLKLPQLSNCNAYLLIDNYIALAEMSSEGPYAC